MNEDLFGLETTRAVVTGGAGQIPGGMAAALVRMGASVALWGRSEAHPIADAAEALAEETGGEVWGIPVDTAESDGVRRALDETIKTMGLPTLLVNGVGGNRGKTPFVDLDPQQFEEVLRLNVMAGLVIPTMQFARLWIERSIPGAIINIASMSSYLPLSGVWAYDAAKSAVMNLTVATAREFAPHHIRVNAIAPGFFIGYQNRALLLKENGQLTERGQAVIDHTPAGRFGSLEDLAGATIFLASERASGYITGVTIPIDGGYLTHNV